MKKKLKWFLIVFGVILIGAASYLLYMFKFKQYDVVDEAVDEIIGELYTIELPDGTVITIDEDGTIVETESGDVTEDGASEADTDDEDVANNGEAQTDGTAENVGSTGELSTSSGPSTSTNVESGSSDTNHSNTNNGNNSEGTAGNGNSGQNGTGQSNPPSKPTVADIKNKYTPSFQALESQANGKLNALVGRAQSEYNAKKANGESIDVGYFYNKYYGAANALEAQTDAVFQGVLSAVEQDLAANGYSTSYAESFANEYNATKKARKDSLLNKALGR